MIYRGRPFFPLKEEGQFKNWMEEGVDKQLTNCYTYNILKEGEPK